MSYNLDIDTVPYDGKNKLSLCSLGQIAKAILNVKQTKQNSVEQQTDYEKTLYPHLIQLIEQFELDFNKLCTNLSSEVEQNVFKYNLCGYNGSIKKAVSMGFHNKISIGKSNLSPLIKACIQRTTYILTCTMPKRYKEEDEKQAFTLLRTRLTEFKDGLTHFDKEWNKLVYETREVHGVQPSARFAKPKKSSNNNDKFVKQVRQSKPRRGEVSGLITIESDDDISIDQELEQQKQAEQFEHVLEHELEQKYINALVHGGLRLGEIE
jgi:hypothetical protein